MGVDAWGLDEVIGHSSGLIGDVVTICIFLRLRFLI
jgi:hypothetical protein